MEGEVDGDVNKGKHFSFKPKLFNFLKTLKVKHISESIYYRGRSCSRTKINHCFPFILANPSLTIILIDFYVRQKSTRVDRTTMSEKRTNSPDKAKL